MTRKIISVLLALFVAMMIVPPALAQAPTETYTSSDGSLTLSYPRGWVLQPISDGVTLLTSESVPATDTRLLNPGEGAFGLNLFSQTINPDFNSFFKGDDVTSKLQSFVDFAASDSTSTVTVGKAASTTVGSHPAAFATGSVTKTGNALEVLLIDFGNGGYGLVFMEAAPNGLSIIEPKMRSIAATIEFTPPEAVPTPTEIPLATPSPINLGSLVPITVQNAKDVKLISTINAFTGGVTSVAISPDNQTIAAASNDGEISLWDAATGQSKTAPATQTTRVQQLLYTPDGKDLISAHADGTVHVWDASTGEQKAVKEHSDAIWWMAISPDSQTLAYISYTSSSQDVTGSKIWLWNLATGQESMIASFTGNLLVNSIIFSADGKQILYSVSDSTNNQFQAVLYDVASGKNSGDWTKAGGPTDAYFTADGQPIISYETDPQSFDVIMWNPQTDKTLFTLKGHTSSVYLTLPNADHTILGTPSFDDSVRLWDAKTGENLTTLPAETSVLGIAFSSDSRLLVTSDGYGEVYIWGVKANL